MNPTTPHIITEDSIQYKLGEIKGNKILYDFKKILLYLNHKGNLTLFISLIIKCLSAVIMSEDPKLRYAESVKEHEGLKASGAQQSPWIDLIFSFLFYQEKRDK